MKKAALLFLLIILILSGCKQKKEASGYDFTFAFLTDIHLQPELNAVEGFQKAIDTLNQIKPDFIITGGDLVRDALNVTHGRADSLYNLYKEVSAGLTMPVYNTIGNHEIFGWESDDEEIKNHPEFGKKMFENRIGERFYSFDHKGWHFIILDAIGRAEDGGYIGEIGEEELEWLKKDIEKTGKETPIALSAHIPFYTAVTQLRKGSLAANSESSVITNAREVMMNLYPYNLRLVLQGHTHFLEDIYVGNKTHFITGGAVCGLWWENKPQSIPDEGFLLVKVRGEQIEWEYVDYGWTPPGE